jgi:ferredoxin
MSKFDEPDHYKQEELLQIDWRPPKTSWMDTPPDIRKGTYIYPGKAKNLKAVDLPHPREWAVEDVDWELPEGWKKTVLEGMAERLQRFRSFKLFMDTCVRCGACADKCHFFLGSGDPKNMPVLRAELLRAVYRKDFTAMGKIFGTMAGARPLTEDVIKEWFYYFFQCTECRRCSVFCPYGIDTAEITMMGRELLGLCHRTGSQLFPVREPPGHPTPRPHRHPGVHGRGYRGGHGHQGGYPGEQEGRRDPLCDPLW